jgi:hypothetical protein
MENIKAQKSYLIGILVTTLIGATAIALGPEKTNQSLIVNIVSTTVRVTIMCFLIAGFITGILWIFKKNYSLARFIRIATIVSVIWTISAILSTMLSSIGY